MIKFQYYLKLNTYLRDFELKVQAAYWICLFVSFSLSCFIRQRTDFAACEQRQGGAAPLTPATFEKVD